MTDASLTNADNSITYDAIVVGAGVIGPCVATGLARKGKIELRDHKSIKLKSLLYGFPFCITCSHESQ